MSRDNAPPVAIAVLAMMGWVSIMMLTRETSVYLPLAAFSAVLLGASYYARPALLSALFRPSLKSVAIGASLGVLMVVGTHFFFRVGAAWIPGLHASVELLYATMRRAPSPPFTVLAMALIVLAEEVVWRGALLGPVGGPESKRNARLLLAASAAGYALSQLGASDPLLIAVAFACGLVWGAVRLWRRDLVAPLAMHAVWNLGVLFLFPLDR